MVAAQQVEMRELETNFRDCPVLRQSSAPSAYVLRVVFGEGG